MNLALKLLKRHWLKIVGMGLTCGAGMIESILHEREMAELTVKIEKDVMAKIMEELAKQK